MPCPKCANLAKKAAWPELEVNLLEWIMEKRNNSLPSLVRLKALERGEIWNSRGGNLKQKPPVSAFYEAYAMPCHFNRKQLSPNGFLKTMALKLLPENKDGWIAKE